MIWARQTDARRLCREGIWGIAEGHEGGLGFRPSRLTLDYPVERSTTRVSTGHMFDVRGAASARRRCPLDDALDLLERTVGAVTSRRGRGTLPKARGHDGRFGHQTHRATQRTSVSR